MDDEIDFSWGSGSPDPSIRNDDFAVRWTGYVIPPIAGDYTFYTYTDDGARFSIDGDPVISGAWRDMGPTEYTSTTVTFDSCAPKRIEMEYYENGGGAVARLSWDSASMAKEVIPQENLIPDDIPEPTITPTTMPTCVYNGTGILGAYYEWSGSPSFNDLSVVRLDDNVDFTWGGGGPGSGLPDNYFSVRWSGYVIPLYPGDYTFYTRSDDGARLYVDGNLVIGNAWNYQAATEYSSTTVTFDTCAAKSIVMEYFEASGDAVAQLSWSTAYDAKAIIPRVNLRPETGSLLATSTPTRTPTITNTPTRTHTPTITPTPTITNTPTITYTPTDTHADANTDTDKYSDDYANIYAYQYPHHHQYTHADAHTDHYIDTQPDSDTDTDEDSNQHAYTNQYANTANVDKDTDGYQYADQDTNANADSYRADEYTDAQQYAQTDVHSGQR